MSELDEVTSEAMREKMWRDEFRERMKRVRAEEHREHLDRLARAVREAFDAGHSKAAIGRALGTANPHRVYELLERGSGEW